MLPINDDQYHKAWIGKLPKTVTHVCSRDSAAAALALTNRPVLDEIRIRRVGARVVTVDIVGCAVGVDGAHVGGTSARVVGSEILKDVCLY